MRAMSFGNQRYRHRAVSQVKLTAAGCVGVVLFTAVFCARERAMNELQTDLVIFHAGSLSVPFRRISERFNVMYPDVIVRAESAGSRDTARKVSDLRRRCDVLGSADYRVIDALLLTEHADFNIRFAANEMVIAYTDSSRYADVITAENWPQLLLTDNVTFGRSDPNRDPCGYRTVVLFQLAERHYGTAGLARKLEEKHGRTYIRPKETDLLALLELGEIDFLFIYRSVASQHGLRFIVLPAEVNLGAAELDGLYATASVEITGKKRGERIERRGAAIVYGATIPKTCGNQEMAEAWIALMLSHIGRDIMAVNGQPPIAPALTDQFARVPETIRPFCRASATE